MSQLCGCKHPPIEKQRAIMRKMEEARLVDNGNLILIGVIFHICYRGYDTSTINFDIAYSIDTLNKDFSKQCSNFDYGRGKYVNQDYSQTYTEYVSLASACNIQFYTAGIRYADLAPQTTSNMTTLDNNIKGASRPVEPEKYLNVWVAEFYNGLLGYAQFPWDNSPETDGVVIAKSTFGQNPNSVQYSLNKTMTHEVGHWLGLYHTFQDTFSYEGGNIDYQDGNNIEDTKGDCVADTPPQGTPTYGNPFTNVNNWPTSRPVDQLTANRHMFMNFMDYSDDIAMFMFTSDQAEKIRQMILLYRPQLISSAPPDPTPVPTPDPLFKSLIYDFDSTPIGWAAPVKLIDTAILFPNATISSVDGITTKPYCLRTRKNSQGEFKVVLNTDKQLIISVFAKVFNPATYIWLKPPGSSTWLSSRLTVNNGYMQYFYFLNKPYTSTSGNTYTIRFGTISSSTAFSYFDEIEIKEYNGLMRLKLVGQ